MRLHQDEVGFKQKEDGKEKKSHPTAQGLSSQHALLIKRFMGHGANVYKPPRVAPHARIMRYMDMEAQPTWFGHPRGLSVLVLTETWERFSYYGMRSILILFMIAPLGSGGLGLRTRQAASIYGIYTMLVYALAIPGGWLADRFLGHYRAVLAGGVFIMLGHFAMAIPAVISFFSGLCLVILGTSVLKPSVSTMVGSLYADEDPRRDSGFSIFYMGINVGAMTEPLICGFLGQKVDWHLGFAAAGMGMLLGLAQYVMGRKHLGGQQPGRA